jgi:hypothetical protein
MNIPIRRMAVVAGAAAALAGCTSSTGAGRSTGANGGQPAGGDVPTKLVGKWQQGSTSDVNFSDGLGSFSAPSGYILAWQFTADGHYAFDDFNQSSLYSCTTAVLGHETGTIDFSADSFTATAATATITSQDNCHAEYNYQKPWENRLGGPRQFQWSLESDASSGRIAFVVKGPDGQTIPYLQPTQAGQ